MCIRSRWFLAALVAGLMGSGVLAFSEQEFEPSLSISDGKDGRLFAKWIQPVLERPVKTVRVRLRKESGGEDTFVNLRFGEDGHTFENGRRVYLADNEMQVVTFDVAGQSPNGKPLVMNAYNGVVLVKKVAIEYHKPPKQP